ncbi:MAG: pyridoxamine 5'-phosphate oxidase [bacterium]|nr:pyridoxamine 5'-phosphate oxidase [bacterium]
MNSNPFAQFETWFAEAKTSEPTLAESFALATATGSGVPSVRMVLLKQADETGFVFYTNLESRKAEELAENPKAALLFHWKSLGRQVRIEGSVETVPVDEARAYYDSRPRASRLSAWASPQSKAIPDRNFLVQKVSELEEKYAGAAVPLPPYWGGYRVVPTRFEFWVNRDDRLHDRFVYDKAPEGWARTLLGP